ncbi:MAG TPA: winged helix-turn-helix domain-containing protein [Blastocatellia bacterium]|nr:winged helix-turn-helix domain-containing protein [Blastocatellia bacterium]
MSKQIKHFYEFGPFRIDPSQRVLLREGQPVSLPPKIFDTLLALIERSGQIVDKDKLLEEVWPETVVEENNLTQYISLLRKALGDDRHEPRYIETIPRRGYRFAAEVREVRAECPDLAVGEHTTVHLVVKEQIEEIEEDQTAKDKVPVPVSLPVRRSGLKRAFIVVSVLAAALAGLIFWTAMGTNTAGTRAGEPPFTGSVAVLPFKILNASEDEQYLGLALADALITKLSNIDQIIVRPTNAVRKYTNEREDPAAAGRELRVEAVLDGNIQRSGDRLRLTVQMIDVAGRRPVWAETFDEKLTDIFLLQDRVADRVAQAMTLKLTGAEKMRLARRYTENAEAYRAYLKGRYFWNKSTEEAIKKGIEYFNVAISIDPNFALAYAGLADCYNSLGSSGTILGALPPSEVYPKAKAAALKALDLDGELAEAHASLARVKWNYDWDRAGAENDFKRSLELDPNLASARHSYAILLAQLGKFDEAAVEIKRAQELDPVSVSISTSLGWVLYWGRQYDQAIEQTLRALELDPTFARTHLIAGRAYLKKGMHGEAIAEFQKGAEISGGRSHALAALGLAYASAGKRGDALEVLNELKQLSKQRYLSTYHTAAIYAELGERDRAFALLEKVIEERSHPLFMIKVDPVFDGLRPDPRFNELLNRTGLAE